MSDTHALFLRGLNGTAIALKERNEEQHSFKGYVLLFLQFFLLSLQIEDAP